ncbi:hypothetical protein [Streptomyces sp. WMMB 322]|uniref:hypothetical protein n=1 Tax=Streptomyces sp. WMMB 322 TaxID=1286821 RepID=UPI0006E22E43|nr:hypothetical protein [Streptomyces sp. WMMB 322]SCK50758.1 hypothetical protein H180DRAFT_04576 [Streptomyces sp. WMMB 322]
MTFTVAAERPPGRTWPLVAQTDDGNPWETGLCMLYCRRAGVRVLWLGPVHASGATGEMYGCGQCIAELDYMVHRQLRHQDRPNAPETAGSSERSWWRWRR